MMRITKKSWFFAGAALAALLTLAALTACGDDESGDNTTASSGSSAAGVTVRSVSVVSGPPVYFMKNSAGKPAHATQLQFKAEVYGDNVLHPNQSVRWWVEDYNDPLAGTKIDPFTGVLTIGENETSPQLKIWAQSLADTNISTKDTPTIVQGKTVDQILSIQVTPPTKRKFGLNKFPNGLRDLNLDGLTATATVAGVSGSVDITGLIKNNADDFLAATDLNNFGYGGRHQVFVINWGTPLVTAQTPGNGAYFAISVSNVFGGASGDEPFINLEEAITHSGYGNATITLYGDIQGIVNKRIKVGSPDVYIAPGAGVSATGKIDMRELSMVQNITIVSDDPDTRDGERVIRVWDEAALPKTDWTTFNSKTTQFGQSFSGGLTAGNEYPASRLPLFAVGDTISGKSLTLGRRIKLSGDPNHDGDNNPYTNSASFLHPDVPAAYQTLPICPLDVRYTSHVLNNGLEVDVPALVLVRPYSTFTMLEDSYVVDLNITSAVQNAEFTKTGTDIAVIVSGTYEATSYDISKYAAVVVNGTFNMQGGRISGNNNKPNQAINGVVALNPAKEGSTAVGGVRVAKANAAASVTFNMSGGIIVDNSGAMGMTGATLNSGDVFIDSIDFNTSSPLTPALSISGATANIGHLVLCAAPGNISGGVRSYAAIGNRNNISMLHLYTWTGNPVPNRNTVISYWVGKRPLSSYLAPERLGNFVNGASQIVPGSQYTWPIEATYKITDGGELVTR
jgi:hypothetical protein